MMSSNQPLMSRTPRRSAAAGESSSGAPSVEPGSCPGGAPVDASRRVVAPRRQKSPIMIAEAVVKATRNAGLRSTIGQRVSGQAKIRIAAKSSRSSGLVDEAEFGSVK